MLPTIIGEKDAPREVRIIWSEEGATAYLPLSEDPGPERRLDYAGESRELVLDAVAERIMGLPPSALIGLFSGSTVDIGKKLSADRVSVSRWRHGRGNMSRLRRERVMQELGFRKVDGLWKLEEK